MTIFKPLNNYFYSVKLQKISFVTNKFSKTGYWDTTLSERCAIRALHFHVGLRPIWWDPIILGNIRI